MKMKTFLITLLALSTLFISTSPCFAYDGLGEYGLGAGVMFPDIDGVDTDNSIYYLFDYVTMGYLFEVNFVDDGDMEAWTIHSNYLYPISSIMQSEAYIGVGYSYIFADSDILDDDSGINICLGFNLQKNLDVRGRYLFLGGGDHILTAGATMYF